MKKKFVSLSLVLMMLISLIPNYANAEQDIKIIVDGKEVKTDVAPFIENGRTMVPVRFIAETMGLTVEYAEATEYSYELITLTDKNGRTIDINSIIVISSDGIVYSEGIEPIYNASIGNDAPLTAMTIKENRSFVPIRYIANALHMDITWNESTNTVELTTNNNSDVYPIFLTKINSDKNELIKYNLDEVEFKNGNYMLKNAKVTLTEYYNSIDTLEFAKRLGIEDNFSDIRTLYGNNVFIMNPERTQLKGIFLSSYID